MSTTGASFSLTNSKTYLFVTALIFCITIGSASQAPAVVLDGFRDASYDTLISSDALGDLASPGPADWDGTLWADLDSMFVTHDEQNLYVFVHLPLYDSATTVPVPRVALD